jgi:CheY-like chemotaxis protein
MPAMPYILMLEDDPDDRLLTSEVLAGLPLSVAVTFLSRPADLLPTLEQAEPLLILMDYNLNPETGLELLKRVKALPQYKHIPVILLGDLADPDFVSQCYYHGANTYATKPTTLEATKRKIGLFFQYWLEVAETKALLTTEV